jgi:magnesium chelatase family protein
MSLGRAFSVAVRGLDGEIVEIEADITSGLPGVHLVGLPDAALQESRDRVRAAITNCGNSWPMARLTLALSPATLPKMGSVYDLALASAVLSANGQKAWERLEKTVLLGELALDGRVRPVKGVLPAVLAAKREGWPAVVVPVDNLAEASLVDGVKVWGVRTLRQLHKWLTGAAQLDDRIEAPPSVPDAAVDLADVVGQSHARFAVEVAAAGAHHLMMTGPPGVGKTMLAQRLPGLLPPLSEAESLEVTAIHSVAGLLSGSTPLITRSPFVAPHHTSSVASLVGGGSGLARPGAVSRAHRGVLFLDECAEIGVSAMEALRTPLEEGEVRLARRDGVARYPARFQLVLAANPCPCAPADPKDCICAPMAKRRYLGKLSGPLLDRVDLRVEMHTARAGAFTVDEGEPTAVVRDRVAAARAVAEERWRPHGIRTNAEVSGALLRRKFRLDAAAMEPLRTALDRGLLSIRGVDRTLRVTRTPLSRISDMMRSCVQRSTSGSRRTEPVNNSASTVNGKKCCGSSHLVAGPSRGNLSTTTSVRRAANRGPNSTG